MKKFNLALFLGCCVIGVCIVISANIISTNLPGTTHVPSSLYVTTSDTVSEFKDYLSVYEVAAFLSISSEDASNLIASGEFDTFGTKIGNSFVVSKIALEGWINNRLSGN